MMRPRRGLGQRPGIGVMLLALQMAQVGFDRIPPVTLVTIGAQVAIFLKLLDFRWPSLSEVCISPISVWYREGYTRLAMAAFFHADEWHLYYNMVSFLWKGIGLERRLGSGYFLYMIAVFTILCNITTVVLAMLAEHLLHDPSYLSQCAVGFSGVIFAVKVVTTHMLPPGVTYIMGLIPVHSRLACWAELVVIQLLVPNASFVGHLAGILVGTAYCKGPLKYVMDILVQRPPSYTYVSASSGYHGYTTGASGYRTTRSQNYTQSNSSRGSNSTRGYNEDEEFRRAMRESMDQAAARRREVPSAPGDQDHPGNSPDISSQPSRLYPDLSQYTGAHGSDSRSNNQLDPDELRRRRLKRLT